MKKNIIIIVAIILVAIFIKMLWGYKDSINTQQQRKAMRVVAVTVDSVKSDDIRRQYTATARVMAKYRVEVLARISGYLIKSHFKEGDYVKAGQVLFEIEPQEYAYAAKQAKGNLDNARAQQAFYNKQLARYKELVDNDYVARSDYDSILAQRDAYNAQVTSLENAYNDARRNLGYTIVKAPVNGRVGIIDVTVGNYVSMSSGPLTTINSSEPMYITFPLDSKDYAELARIDGDANAKREVEYIFSSGQKYPYKGVQDFYDNKVDESTGTITLRATFPNPDNSLLQGDFGRIIIYSNKKDKMPIVPQSATMENQEGLYVYVMDEQNLPRLTYIKTLGQIGSNWIVSEGVNIGDKIITTGMQKVIPGAPVKVVQSAVASDSSDKKKTGLVQKIVIKITKIFSKGDK